MIPWTCQNSSDLIHSSMLSDNSLPGKSLCLGLICRLFSEILQFFLQEIYYNYPILHNNSPNEEEYMHCKIMFFYLKIIIVLYEIATTNRYCTFSRHFQLKYPKKGCCQRLHLVIILMKLQPYLYPGIVYMDMTELDGGYWF